MCYFFSTWMTLDKNGSEKRFAEYPVSGGFTWLLKVLIWIELGIYFHIRE